MPGLCRGPSAGALQGFKAVPDRSDERNQAIIPFRQIVLVASLLLSWVGVIALANKARAGDCLAGPNSPAPPGSHWYYRLDWATQRKCWYVRSLSQSDHQAKTPAPKGQDSLLPSVPGAARPQPAADNASLSVGPGNTNSPSAPVEAFGVKPNGGSVSGGTTDEPTFSTLAVSASRQEATSPETNAQAAASPSDGTSFDATNNAAASSSPKEPAQQANRFPEFTPEPAPGTLVTAPAGSRGDGPVDNAETPIKLFVFIVILGVLVLGILSFAIPKRFKNQANKIRASAEVSEIAASIASKLARNRDDSGESGDLQQAEAFVPNEANLACENERLAESAASKRVTAQMLPPRPHMKATSDEYWANADACLNWAREAPTDEIRLGCLALAETWLKVAMRNDGGATSALPRAPTL